MTDSVAPALEVREVSFHFGKRAALQNLSFALEPGKFTALLGQNGAGKTTLFSLITRLYSTQQGQIQIFGHDLRKSSAAALQRLGVVFQQRTVDMDLTVRQNLLYFAALHGMPRSEAKQRMAVELERIGLSDRLEEKIRKLSGGQLRRVEIARALLHQPSLILLDEPTVGLDIGSRQGILNHMRELCNEERISLLWATHLIDEVEVADQVLVLHQGKLVAQGRVEEVVAQTGAQNIKEAFQRLTDQEDSVRRPA